MLSMLGCTLLGCWSNSIAVHQLIQHLAPQRVLPLSLQTTQEVQPSLSHLIDQCALAARTANNASIRASRCSADKCSLMDSTCSGPPSAPVNSLLFSFGATY